MKKVISLLLLIAMCIPMALTLASCTGSGLPDAFVIMSEELDGLFNPFYSTTGADNTIVSMTQIGMLTSGMRAEGATVRTSMAQRHSTATRPLWSRLRK